MSKVQTTYVFAGKTPDTVYAAAEVACPKVGFEIWKSRPMAWLLQLRKEAAGGEIQASIACRPGRDTQVVTTVSSDTMQEAELRDVAEQLAQAVQGEIH